jgi:shikimate 5-dehydrogenase
MPGKSIGSVSALINDQGAHDKTLCKCPAGGIGPSVGFSLHQFGLKSVVVEGKVWFLFGL